jgi:hypothetical protein
MTTAEFDTLLAAAQTNAAGMPALMRAARAHLDACNAARNALIPAVIDMTERADSANNTALAAATRDVLNAESMHNVAMVVCHGR